jgi:uncharacterized protein YkwD
MQASPTSPDRPSSTDVPSSLLQLTNAERGRAGLSAVSLNPQLTRAAQIQAEQMMREGQLEHVVPSAPFPNPEDRLAAVGYRWQAFGENIALEPDPAQTVSTWMNSPPHRSNMLSPTYTEIGAGYARDAQNRSYYVEVFGRPAS